MCETCPHRQVGKGQALVEPYVDRVLVPGNLNPCHERRKVTCVGALANRKKKQYIDCDVIKFSATIKQLEMCND